MANLNVGNYGLGYYGRGGLGQQNCAVDMYGQCTAPAGPYFSNLSTSPCSGVMQPMNLQTMQVWQNIRLGQNGQRLRSHRSGGTLNYGNPVPPAGVGVL